MYQRDFDFSEENKLYKLSVVLMADSFFYAIFDTKGMLISHHSHTFIRFSDESSVNTIKLNPLLTAKYDSISVIVLSGDTHQIDMPDDKLLNIFAGLQLKNVKLEKIPGQNIYNYFGVTPHQESLLNDLFGNENYKIRSFVSLLSTYFLGTEEPLLHLHLEDGVIYIYVQKVGKVYLYNSFQTKSMNDILFFTLATCNATGLDPAKDKVTVSGWIEKESALFKQLQGYISEIHIISDVLFMLHPTMQSKLKTHYYFVHNINTLCVS